MKPVVTAVVLAALAVVSPCRAFTYTVDCTGGGDFEDLPAACEAAGPADTVLVMPCVYDASSLGWPIALTPESPTIVGAAGATVTILQGPGSSSAFYTGVVPGRARICISGLTLRDFRKPIDHVDAEATLWFTDNVIESCTRGLPARNAGASSLVARNVNRDITYGGLSIYHTSGVFEDNEICHNGYGICGVCCEEPLLRRNDVHHNELYGLMTGFYYHVQDNFIHDNPGTGVIMGTSGVLSGNIITGNGIGMERSSTMGSVHTNDVFANSSYNVVMYGGSGSSVDMTMNWWGSVDPLEIAASIFDCEDSPSLACVEFVPFCEAPGCAGTASEPQTWGSIKALFR